TNLEQKALFEASKVMGCRRNKVRISFILLSSANVRKSLQLVQACSLKQNIWLNRGRLNQQAVL
ncbi:MAG: hypothetical protein ACUZ77_10620, partial [Candidatus Brocadiales bacterium]